MLVNFPRSSPQGGKWDPKFKTGSEAQNGDFPKLGTCLGVPIIRIIVFWDLYWGPPILGNYQIDSTRPKLSEKPNMV